MTFSIVVEGSAYSRFVSVVIVVRVDFRRRFLVIVIIAVFGWGWCRWCFWIDFGIISNSFIVNVIVVIVEPLLCREHLILLLIQIVIALHHLRIELMLLRLLIKLELLLLLLRPLHRTGLIISEEVNLLSCSLLLTRVHGREHLLHCIEISNIISILCILLLLLRFIPKVHDINRLFATIIVIIR